MPGLLDQFQIFDRPVFRDAQKVLINEKCCIYDNPNRLKSISSEYLHLTGQFYQSWKYFDGNLPEIQSFVKPSGDFGPLPKSEIDNFITCIHIRRTDFVDGEHHSSDLNFTRSAMNFIMETEKAKNRRMLTVIMGDDPNFEASIFENSERKGSEMKNTTKYFVSENTPYDDLAYSRYHCDTVLITAPSSTFGWWLGYLSKGNSVYYQDIRSTNDVNYRLNLHQKLPLLFFNYERLFCLRFRRLAISSVSGIINIGGGGKKCGGGNGGYGSGIIIGAPKPGGK